MVLLVAMELMRVQATTHGCRTYVPECELLVRMRGGVVGVVMECA